MARTDWFVQDRFGMFIHFGLSAIQGKDLSWPMSWERIPSSRWRAYAQEFNPDKGGPREWVRLAKQAGCRYAVLTVKHHEGFCLWDSKLTDYTSVKAPRCQRDLAREFVDACRAEGIKPGFYYSLIDWDHPDYPVADKLHPERDNAEALARPRDWNRYLAYMHGQVREILSNYGEIFVLWLDFSYDNMSGDKWQADQLMAMVRELQPNIVVDNRLVAGHEDPSASAKHGDFATPEQVIPPEGVTDAQGNPKVWESCMTLGDTWGYCSEGQNFKSPTSAVRMLVECVAKGGNLLVNIGPNARGVVRAQEADALRAIGAWMDLNSESIIGAGHAVVGGKLLSKPQWGWYTRKGDILFAHMTERPNGPVPLMGLGQAVEYARFLHDGAEISMHKSFNAVRGDDNAVLSFRRAKLPDPVVTTVALKLKPGF
jgi:alpha-L-fucosidase